MRIFTVLALVGSTLALPHFRITAPLGVSIPRVNPTLGMVAHEAPLLPPGYVPGITAEGTVVPVQTHSSSNVSFRVALRPAAATLLKKKVASVSDPQSSRYGSFLSRDDVARLAAPSTMDVAAVTNWLAAANIPFTLSRDTSVVDVTTTIERAQALLSTQFETLVHKSTGHLLVRAGDYMLPEHIDRVATIYGLHGFALERVIKTTVASRKPAITPEVIAKQYSIPPVTNTTTPPNAPKDATVNMQGEFPCARDLQLFFKRYLPQATAGEDTWVRVVGDDETSAGRCGTEAEMDVQIIRGLTPQVSTEVWAWKSMDFCGDLKSWTTAVLGTSDADVPRVFTLSYGWQGDLARVGCVADKVLDIDLDFQKIAARGISLIVSSGDSGAGYGGERGSERSRHPHTFYAAWPASSAWVTAVGATEFIGDILPSAEQPVTSFGSGGGFSTYAGSDDRSDASWQEAAVQGYLAQKSILPPRSVDWSPNGRATPDVAGLGSPEYQFFVDGSLTQNGGTSASAPMFASIIARLNLERAERGMPPMGFLNPWLYQNEHAFTDITVGDNSHCDWGAPATFGFNATRGWDPVTGLGVPHFEKMLAAAIGEPYTPAPGTPPPTTATPTAESCVCMSCGGKSTCEPRACVRCNDDRTCRLTPGKAVGCYGVSSAGSYAGTCDCATRIWTPSSTAAPHSNDTAAPTNQSVPSSPSNLTAAPTNGTTPTEPTAVPTNASTPSPTQPSTSSLCAAHSMCTKLRGACCPTKDGVMLDCCNRRHGSNREYLWLQLQ